jgi:hypothetical protein
MLAKPISKSHITERRFSAYLKANTYIKHLNRIYESTHNPSISDKAYSLSKNFQVQTPSNLDFKVSMLPKSQVSKELEEKTDLLHKYQNIEEIRPRRKLATRSLTPVMKKQVQQRDFRERKDLKQVIQAITTERKNKCEDCKKTVCECIEKTEDSFLQKFINSRIYQEIKKNKESRASPCFVTVISTRSKDSEFSVLQDKSIGFSIFDDGSLTAINSVGRSPFKSKSSKRTQVFDKNFDKLISVSPVSYSARSKFLI